jgi:hypothetical protein
VNGVYTTSQSLYPDNMLLLKWLDRSKITLIIGSLILVLGAKYPWYELPVDVLEQFNTNLVFANTCRIFSFCIGILCLIFSFWLGARRISRLAVWGSLVFTLLFPYFITVWSPTVTFIASSYFDQGFRVRLSIESQFSEIQSQWKQNIALPFSGPVSISDFQIRDSRFFQMSAWDQILVEGLGYTNSFFGLIGRGWALTVIGLVVVLFALYLCRENAKLDTLVLDISRLLPWLGAFFATLIFSLILPIIVDHRLDTLFAKGEYSQVLSSSQQLASVYPPFRGDREFLKRWGIASYYANDPDPSLISFVKGMDRYFVQDLLGAEEYFRQSLTSSSQNFLAKSFLASTILREGIKFFGNPATNDSRQPSSAAEKFEEVLEIFPHHIVALYNLMIARAVDGEFEKSAQINREIVESQKYFQQPILSLLGQAYLHSAWASYQNDDFNSAWRQYRKSIDSSAWKEDESSSVTDHQFPDSDE